MEIEVLNCKDDRLKDYVIRAIEFYGKKLITNKRIYNNIYIEIEFTDDIKDLGSASVDGYNSAKKAREFLIEINNKISGKSVLQTLAHEMIHIKQYIYDEINEDLNKWKHEIIDSDNMDYYDYPWEIEAYGKEQGLFSGFVIQEKLWDVFNGIYNPESTIKKQKICWKK
jgi:hypothetical protein